MRTHHNGAHISDDRYLSVRSLRIRANSASLSGALATAALDGDTTDVGERGDAADAVSSAAENMASTKAPCEASDADTTRSRRSSASSCVHKRKSLSVAAVCCKFS